MDHGPHASTGSAAVDLTALLIRLVLLLGTVLVAGTGLLRPSVAAPSRRVVLATGAAGGLAATLAIVSVPVLGVNVVGGVVHAALTLAVPLLLGRPPLARWVSAALLLLVVLETALGRSGPEFAVDTVYVGGAAVWLGAALVTLGANRSAWRGSSVRPGPLALTLGVLLTVAGLVRFGLSGLGADRRLYETAFGLLLAAVIVLPAAATVVAVLVLRRQDGPGRAYRLGAAGIAAAFVAWSALAVVPEPAELPTPGVPLLATVSVHDRDVPVLVSPQRPGRNLVHFPGSAGEGLVVGVEGGLSEPAVLRSGAGGTWAEVDLPPGRSELVIRHDGDEDSVEVDAGEERGPESASGVDGPECATAALGGLVAGARAVLGACPADTLSEDDADALRKQIGFLADHGTPAITLAGDESPRGVAAAAAVREEAGRRGLPVLAEPAADAALVVVGGWEAAHTATTRAARLQQVAPTYVYGIQLAPWLLTSPVVNSVATSSVPLRFDPREERAVSFTVRLGNAFGGERPTLGGYLAWLAAQGQQLSGEVRVFASAQVNAMPMNPGTPHAPGMAMTGEGAGHWIEHGTVVPVSLPLLPLGGQHEENERR
ncbi:hypothetical protein [Prauserella flavalba]|uniref:Uncharacterized protein n=1 Tax=Prauserella flavalba TaxID=1477506 RepID=A0A318LI20_9PSEU|nr:hypothetical protein [Prauserella flavalba]PXY28590.1 hypothetical protein BA062_22260 [Prauserella flavalba]